MIVSYNPFCDVLDVIDQIEGSRQKKPQSTEHVYSVKDEQSVEVQSAENFPLELEKFTEVLDILGGVNNNLRQMAKVMQQLNHLENRCFPLKVTVPLQYSMNLSIEFTNFKFSAPDASLFAIQLPG